MKLLALALFLPLCAQADELAPYTAHHVTKTQSYAVTVTKDGKPYRSASLVIDNHGDVYGVSADAVRSNKFQMAVTSTDPVMVEVIVAGKYADIVDLHLHEGGKLDWPLSTSYVVHFERLPDEIELSL